MTLKPQVTAIGFFTGGAAAILIDADLDAWLLAAVAVIVIEQIVHTARKGSRP